MILYPVLASLCHVVTDDPHNRPTWLFCVFGSSRRLLCSEKKLVSFLESSSTPWGKRVIISLLLEYRFLKDCMWSTVSNLFQTHTFIFTSVCHFPGSSLFLKLQFILLSILPSRYLLPLHAHGLIISTSPVSSFSKNVCFLPWTVT